MAERTVIGKNVWLFVDTGTPPMIPIKCLTSHSITASQEIANIDTKCGRQKSPQGDPDFQITGEGQVMLFTNPDTGTAYSSGDLFDMIKLGDRVTVVSGPASGTPVEGDETYTGEGYVSEWEVTYPAAEQSTFTFTFDMETLVREVEPATT